MGRSYHLCNVIVLCCILFIIPCWCHQGANMSTYCVHVERQALLEFKHSFTDPSNRLRSWVGEHCCSWAGIRCDGNGHVIKLDLRNPHPFHWKRYFANNRTSDPIYAKSALVGQEVNPSLLDLKHLKHLDLSSNNFFGSRIPNFLGSFLNLRYLNLSSSFFGGIVPQHLGNLSALRSLDLSAHSSPYKFPRLSIDNLNWVSRLSHLKHLDMSLVDLGQTSNSLQAINLLPHLLELHLYGCEISENLQSNLLANLTSMVVLVLGKNNFQGPLPNFVENMTSLQVLNLYHSQFNGTIQNDLSHLCNLETLDLSENKFQGEIHKLFENSSSSLCFKNNKLEALYLYNNNLSGYAPNWLTKLKNLRVLDLGGNSFVGHIPSFIWELSSLRSLYLSGNKFNGSIPESLGQLSHLEILCISSFESAISDAHLANLSALKILDLRSNSLKIRSDWIPPFQLDEIWLGSCKMGSDFPMWLQTQKSFSVLNISNASIIGPVPEWLFNFSFPYSRKVVIDISSNQFNGKVPNFFSSSEVGEVYFFLQNNNFEGPLPHFPSNAIAIDISHNSISGPIHENIGVMLPNLKYLLLSNNSLSGIIPHSLCQMEGLYVLDLSGNHLSGDLPQCWSELQPIQVLDLSSTNLSGIIPSSIGKLVQLKSLHLNGNKLYGQIPFSLMNCTKLKVMDLGENKFFGHVPKWIGKYLLNLKILRLRQNSFNGTIPSQLCLLKNLQLLDLAYNNISGTVPHCFGNFSGMVKSPSLENWHNESYFYNDKIEVIMGGQIFEYSKIISLVTGLHMSSNNLVGGIPEELMNLTALRALDLSKNHLGGSIPEAICKMKSLEYFSLSENQFSDSIPQSMTALTSLSHLDLSYNKFSGKIPSGNQFLTFDPSSFIGNPELCGAPLKSCPVDSSVDIVLPKIDDEGIIEMNWFYVGLASGHVVGFSGFCGMLLFNKTWAIAYFQFLNVMKDWLLVMIELKIAQLKQKLDKSQVGG